MQDKVEIVLDRKRVLCFDFNAQCSLEEATGESLLDPEFQKRLMAKPRQRDTRALLWAALRGDDPELTLEGAGKLITFDNVGLIAAKLQEAVIGALPSGSKRKKKDPTQDSPGTNSGQ